MSGYLARLVQHARGESALVRPFTPVVTAPDPGMEAWDHRAADVAPADPVGRSPDAASALGEPPLPPPEPLREHRTPPLARAVAPTPEAPRQRSPEQSALPRPLAPAIAALSLELPEVEERDRREADVAPADPVSRSPGFEGSARGELPHVRPQPPRELPHVRPQPPRELPHVRPQPPRDHRSAPLARAVAPTPDVPPSGALRSASVAPAPALQEPDAPREQASLGTPAALTDAVAGAPAPRIEIRAGEPARGAMATEATPPGAPPVVTREARSGAWSSVAPIAMELLAERPAEPYPGGDGAWALDMRPLARPSRVAADPRGARDERAAPGARSAEVEARERSSPTRGPEPAAAEAKGAGATVEVSIGRIEVRVAPQPRAEPSGRAAPARPAVDLGEYLRRREQG